MKKTLIAALILLQTSLFAQTLFTGDKKELNQQVLLKKIPAIKVWNKSGKAFTLTDYISNNTLHNGKAYLIIQWGRAFAAVLDTMNKIHSEGLADQYNVIALYTSNKKGEEALSDMEKELARRPNIDNRWAKFSILATNSEEVAKDFYIDTYPNYIFTDNKMNVIAITGYNGFITVKKILDGIQNQKIQKYKKWYLKEGGLVSDSDKDAYYYSECLVKENHIQTILGTKTKLLYNLNYVLKDNEYLYDGIFEAQNEAGQKTASGRFKDGIPIEPFTQWFENGKIKSIYPVNGIYKVFTETNKIMYEGPIENGLGNGKFTMYNEDGSKKSETNYKTGVLYGLQKKYAPEGRTAEWFESTEFESGFYLSEGLQRVKKNKLWGYIDRAGKLIIPYKYSAANDFSEGKANVELNNLYGYIDKIGKVVIPFKYTYADKFKDGKASVTLNGEGVTIDLNGLVIEEKKSTTTEEEVVEEEVVDDCDKYLLNYNVVDGIRRVKSNDKYGFISEQCKEITAIKYDDAQDFSEGMASVTLNKKMGFINTEGEEVVPLKYAAADPFKDGTAKVIIFSNNAYYSGFIDKAGNEIIPVIYYPVYRSGNDLVKVAKNKKYGMLDWNGKIVIPLMYESIGNFSEDRAEVQLNGKYGFIDKKNNQISEIKYDETMNFVEGMAAVRVGTPWGVWGYINKDGIEVIKPEKYVRAKNYTNGLAMVGDIKSNWWGMIDKTGKVIIPFKYSNISSAGFIENRLNARIGDHWGIVDRANNIIVPFIYDNIRDFADGMASVELNEKYGYVNTKGELVIPIKYDSALDFEDGKGSVKENGQWFVLNKKGERIK